MSTKVVELSAEAVAIAKAFEANPNAKMSLADICGKAGIEPKSGYLKSVERALADKGTLVRGDKDLEVKRTITSKVNSYTFVPNTEAQFDDEDTAEDLPDDSDKAQ